MRYSWRLQQCVHTRERLVVALLVTYSPVPIVQVTYVAVLPYLSIPPRQVDSRIKRLAMVKV